VRARAEACLSPAASLTIRCLPTPGKSTLVGATCEKRSGRKREREGERERERGRKGRGKGRVYRGRSRRRSRRKDTDGVPLV